MFLIFARWLNWSFFPSSIGPFSDFRPTAENNMKKNDWSQVTIQIACTDLS